MTTLLSTLTEAPEFLKIANLNWGTKHNILGSASDYEEAIFKQITSVQIIKNLHQGDLWKDIRENKDTERARTLTRIYTIKKIAHSLKHEEYFLSNIMEEFEQLTEPHQLITIMNYNKFIKYGQWTATIQFACADDEILQRWGYMDNFIYGKEQQIKNKIDNAFCVLENDLFDIFGVDNFGIERVTDDTIRTAEDNKIILLQDDKRIVKKAISTQCDCGGRYTDHNLYKHLRTDRHIRFKGGRLLDDDHKIQCACGDVINRYQYIRHTATITHNFKLRLKKQQGEKEANTDFIELTD
jgi:hypothetical protein